MNRNMRAFFDHALTRSDVESEVQKQAYRFATRNKDTALLVSLARNPNLAPDVESDIKGSQDLEVLRAWATRPGQTVEAVIERFRSEKRVTLLNSLAGEQGLPEELYRSLADRQAVSLNWQLLANPSVPQDLRLEIAARLGRSCTRLDRRIHTEFEQVRSAGAEFLRPFLAASTNYAMLRMAVRDAAERDEELARVGVDRMLELAEDTDMARALAYLARNVDARGVLEHIAQGTQRLLVGREDERTDNRSYLHEAFSQATERSTVDVDEILAPISSAATAMDIRQEVNAAQSTLRRLGYWVGKDQIARLVLSNPNIDVELLSSYWSMGTKEQIDAIADRAVAQRDRDMAVAVMGHAGQFSYGDLVAKYAAQAEDVEEFLSWLIGSEGFAPRPVLRSSVIQEDPDRALRLLPVSDVLHLAAAQGLVASSLGDSPEAWDTFGTLVDEWSGSLPDLLATVSSFTPAR